MCLTKMKKILKKYGFIDESSNLRVYWSPCANNQNFGDKLTPYLIQKITGIYPLQCSKHCIREYYAVIGSILGLTNRNAIIWGSGIISRYQNVKRPKKILAVRGPETRRRLLEMGYKCPKIYGDPALLLPKFYFPKIKKKYEFGVIPHYVDYEKVKLKVKSKNILVIDLLKPVENVINDILSCKKTISSSLHGIITSQAYNIPSIWVKFSNDLAGDDTKFKDYFLSVGIIPYNGIKIINKKLSEREIYEIFQKLKPKKPKINTKSLWEACPLRS